MEGIPQIDNGKRPEEQLNVRHIAWLPSSTPYGNLLLKKVNIIRRIDRVNLEIRRAFSSYVHPSKADVNDPYQDLLEHQFYAEQVVYWLRKTADEIIALAYVIDGWNKTGEWPNSVRIDSIANLKGNDSEELRHLFEPHDDFLTTLNEVANAFKHSFINTDITLVGAEYPVVFALGLKYNKLSNAPKFHSVSFAEMVSAFSGFYQQTMTAIQGWAMLAKAKNDQKGT